MQIFGVQLQYFKNALSPLMPEFTPTADCSEPFVHSLCFYHKYRSKFFASDVNEKSHQLDKLQYGMLNIKSYNISSHRLQKFDCTESMHGGIPEWMRGKTKPQILVCLMKHFLCLVAAFCGWESPSYRKCIIYQGVWLITSCVHKQHLKEPLSLSNPTRCIAVLIV